MKTALKVLGIGFAAMCVGVVGSVFFPDYRLGIMWLCAYWAGVYSGSKWSLWS